MAAKTFVLDHNPLGTITGVEVSNLPVTNFLGVKYASVKERFAESELFEHATQDTTRFGPACPQVPVALQIEQEQLIQKTLPVKGEPPAQSDTECLNLNITVPKNVPRETKLPVLVWIHGGGFMFGANFWPQTDMSRLVALGAETGKPFIGVSINYRTNLFGFLASSELDQFGIHGNRGIKDQINAFLWIRKFISGFGGDPENVTAIGESCGGVSATLLLQSKEPLFRKVVSMGGHALLMAPVPLEQADAAYAGVIAALGLDDLSPEDRIAKLRTIPVEEIIRKVPASIPNRPVIDGALFPKALSSVDVKSPTAVDRIPGKGWCEELMIGDCQADGYILASGLLPRKQHIASHFIASIIASFHAKPRLVASILAAYQINEAQQDDEAFDRIVALYTDIAFYAPTNLALKGWPQSKSRYLYHFNAANPFPGPLQGKASHVLDVAYAFQNYNEFLSGEEVEVAREFGLAIIDFAWNGKPGWNVWSEDGLDNFKVFGYTADKIATLGAEGKTQRRPFAPRLLQEYSYEMLWGALQGFLGGR